jgi:2-hydroxychromene-2-carboxylate isomerase
MTAKTQERKAPSGELDVYIDLRSPYSYVAVEPLRRFAREMEHRLRWHPYAIDIEAAYGAQDARDGRALRKVKYIYRDARRLAAVQGLEIRGPKRIYDARLAHLGLLFAEREGFVDAYIDAVYRGFFTHALEIDNPAAIAGLIADLGGAPDRFETFASGPGPAALESERERAEALGVFGVPAIVFDGELYWGADRLPLVRQAILDKRRTS